MFFPQRRIKSSAKWFLLFCLSQFVVHLFTFLLVPHRRPGLSGLVLRGRFLGAPQCCAARLLLLFGLLDRFAALTSYRGARLFGFGSGSTVRPLNLGTGDGEDWDSLYSLSPKKLATGVNYCEKKLQQSSVWCCVCFIITIRCVLPSQNTQ